MNLCIFAMMVNISLEFYSERSRPPGCDLEVKVTEFSGKSQNDYFACLVILRAFL